MTGHELPKAVIHAAERRSVISNGIKKQCRQKKSNGFGLIEIVVVTAVITITLFAFLQTGIVAIKLLRAEKQNLEAMMLAQESFEAVRSIRDESWTGNIAPLTNGIPYYPVVISNKWALTTTDPGLINGKYTRYVIFDQVVRDAQDKISSTGTTDNGTRKLTARTTWDSKQIELVTYITNFQESLTQPTESKSIYYEDAPTDTDLASFPSNNAGEGDPSQSFVTGGTIAISKIELYLKRTTTTPSDIFVELRSNPTGVILGTSNIITAATIPTASYSWVEFRFPQAISVNATTAYYIRLRSSPNSTDAGSGSMPSVRWGYKQTASSPYAGGVARRYVGQLSNPTDSGQQLDEYDFGFRVYALQ